MEVTIMKSFTYTITDEVGIHARPAGLLVKAAKECSSEAVVICDGKSADAKKLMALMSLGVKQGQTVTVEVTGDQEEADVATLEKFFQENL